jgi:bifunctional DNA-binding transcriptional regulator/antitoxin component of YhaV-PrlF toxin-antitoxin module
MRVDRSQTTHTSVTIYGRTIVGMDDYIEIDLEPGDTVVIFARA